MCGHRYRKNENVHYFLPNTKTNIKISPVGVQWENTVFKIAQWQISCRRKRERDKNKDTQQ